MVCDKYIYIFFTNEYLNMLVTFKNGQMNIPIYLSGWIDPKLIYEYICPRKINKCFVNENICLNRFEYI